MLIVHVAFEMRVEGPVVPLTGIAASSEVADSRLSKDDDDDVLFVDTEGACGPDVTTSIGCRMSYSLNVPVAGL